MIAGVVFDKDGTLFDFRRSWGDWSARLLTALASDALHASRMAQAIGFEIKSGDFHPESPVIAATAVEIAHALLPHLPEMSHEDLVAQMNAMAEAATMAEAVPLLPTLTALRALDLRLGLATNDTERPARTHLAAHGVVDLFDFVAGYDSGHGAKPGPGMLLAFARATGLTPAQVVMVGDSVHDMMAGRGAGMACVAVLTGIADSAELAPHADVVLPDISHLANWIQLQNLN